ncbi:MAG: MipA/OmpV family protein [Syntrophaceae bacterium]|nr:MipA/OmpV family protein [Syntrophaceae bacterium]
MRIRYVNAAVLFILSFLLSSISFAEEKPLWEVGVGMGMLQMPDYRGSNESRFYVLPYPYLVYRGDILKVDEQRISGRIFKTDRILLDFSGYGSVPVKSSDNKAREGMPDLDPTFELGPALKIKLWEQKENKTKLDVTLPVRAFFSTDFSSVRHEGWVFSPRINFVKDNLIPDIGLNLGLSAGPMFADSGYHDYYYTVEHRYANKERHEYSAGGGYSGSTLTVGLSKSYKQFIFSAFVSADFLQRASFEDSPLVKREISMMSGCSVSWILYKSPKTVNMER